MNIEGMGEALVNQLADCKMLKDIADIYSLDKEMLLSLERMGEKSATNILDEIEKSRHAGLMRVVMGLGIRFVGERTAEALTEHFGSIDAVRDASLEELQEDGDVGPRGAPSSVEVY